MSRIRFLIIFFLFFSIGFPPRPANAEVQKIEDYKLKALFLYQFAGYVSWPRPHEKFQIAIYGKNPKLFEYLQKIAETKQIRSSKIEVIQTTDIEILSDSQVVFFHGKEHLEQEKKAIQKLSDKEILILADHGHSLDNGAMILFLIRGKKLKFSISKSNINNANLQISSKILKLAEEVK